MQILFVKLWIRSCCR